MKKIKVVAAGLLAAFSISACSAPSTPADEIFVHKGSGITEGKENKGCVEPATREINWGDGMGDDYFAYPASQRWFDFSKPEGGDAKPFVVVSKDGQQLTIPGRVDFTLNTNCETLQRFHDLVGNREQAYIVDGEDGARVAGPGWNRILNNYFQLPIDSALDAVAKKYTWRELRSDLTIKDEMNSAVNASLTKLVNQQISGEDDFFLNFSTLVRQPEAPADLVKTETDRETALAQAATTEAKAVADAKAAQAAADAQVAQKNAELEVAKKEAEIRAAEIRSFGGPEAYAKWQAVQKGINPWQPSYGNNAVVTP
jgi:hypothetical protein